MSLRRSFAALAASCALLASAATVLAQSEPAADTWYKVAISGNEVAFVDTTSIQRIGDKVQVRVKENYLAPVASVKKGKTYQSARTDYRLDCAGRKVAMLETRAFAGTDLQGKVVQKASRKPDLDGRTARFRVRRNPGLRLQARAGGLSRCNPSLTTSFGPWADMPWLAMLHDGECSDR